MDHPCHKCKQPVEDGIPFCSHCGAPQIRVVMPEAIPPSAPAGSETAHSLDPVVLQDVPLAAGVSLPVHWAQALRPCMLAALTAVLLTGLGLNPFVAMLGVGFLAVVFYRQRRQGTSIKPATGARLGALSGLLWFGFSVLVNALLDAFLHERPEIRKLMLEKIQQAASGATDPQALAVFDYFKTPQGFVVAMAVGLVLVCFMSIVLGAIGGALGGFFLARRDRT